MAPGESYQKQPEMIKIVHSPISFYSSAEDQNSQN